MLKGELRALKSGEAYEVTWSYTALWTSLYKADGADLPAHMYYKRRTVAVLVSFWCCDSKLDRQ